ncbi:MAG TPA: sulfate adenylyltransferase subunit CysN [Oscillatoriaceae cyanobacterium]
MSAQRPEAMPAHLATPPQDTLRLITCGSVDDGKSTLIGRLLHDSHNLFEDQLSALQADSRAHGTQGDRLDLALLVDGLQAEREQGITIDVAYRFFATEKRKFIVADCPGHEQYTRNMATGASTAQLAVLLVDARKGLLTQTCRHARIVSLMGVKRVVLAVNKLDLLDYGQSVFAGIESQFRDFAAELGFREIVAIPLSALEGDNVTQSSRHMPWYEGPTLLEHLETVPVDAEATRPFRMPVQWVNRASSDFRGYAGRIAAGEVRPGDPVRVLPSGVTTRVSRIVTLDGDLPVAHAGQAVTLTLEDERDIIRGDVLAAGQDPCGVADQFEAQLIWFHENPLLPGRPYDVLVHTRAAIARVMQLKWRLDVNNGAHLAAKTLGMNEIATVTLSLDRPVAFEPYAACPAMGAFILVDRVTRETVGAGMLTHALRRASNLHWQALSVDQSARAAQKSQKPRCIWLTGLSGAGKSTIANLLEQRLHASGRHTYVLDGDNVRHGLNRDLGFTEADRVENVRRMAEVAALMVDAGLIVIVSAISPYRSERTFARGRLGEGQFVEVFVDTPLEVCAARDPKGLYAKAKRGEIKNFTGIDSAYEAPETPEVVLEPGSATPEACVEKLLAWLALTD